MRLKISFAELHSFSTAFLFLVAWFQDSLVQGSASRSDLSSILDPSKFNDAHVSPRLRDFYRKLLETDAQIKNLKKGIYESPFLTNLNYADKKNFYRLKRAAPRHRKKRTEKENPKEHNRNQPAAMIYKTTTVVLPEYRNPTIERVFEKIEKEKTKDKQTTDKNQKTNGKPKRNDKKKTKESDKSKRKKRMYDDRDSSSVVIHKKQLIVQYDPMDRDSERYSERYSERDTERDTERDEPIFPRCSHVTQSDRRFYKTKEKIDQEQIDRHLDEILDKYIEKNWHALNEKMHDALVKELRKNIMPELMQHNLRQKSNPKNEESLEKQEHQVNQENKEYQANPELTEIQNYLETTTKEMTTTDTTTTETTTTETTSTGTPTTEFVTMTKTTNNKTTKKPIPTTTSSEWTTPSATTTQVMKTTWISQEPNGEVKLTTMLSDLTTKAKEMTTFANNNRKQKHYMKSKVKPLQPIKSGQEHGVRKRSHYFKERKQPYKLSVSLSTIEKEDFYTPNYLSKLPVRKLMQMEYEDDDTMGYENVKDVLTDEKDTDENDQAERKRRKVDDKFEDIDEGINVVSTASTESTIVPINMNKYHPLSMNNPNSKGLMPLYPDELSSLVQDWSEDTTLSESKPYKKIRDGSGNLDASAVDYTDDYGNNEDLSGKLTRLAQAYSDYGVIHAKDTVKILNIKKEDKRVKLSNEKNNTEKNTTLMSQSEGILFQYRPNDPVYHRDDDPKEILQMFQKHLRFSKPPTKKNNKYFSHTTLVPMSPDFDIVYNPNTHLMVKDKKKEKPIDNSYNIDNVLRDPGGASTMQAFVSSKESLNEGTETEETCKTDEARPTDDATVMPELFTILKSHRDVDWNNVTVDVTQSNHKKIHVHSKPYKIEPKYRNLPQSVIQPQTRKTVIKINSHMHPDKIKAEAKITVDRNDEKVTDRLTNKLTDKEPKVPDLTMKIVDDFRKAVEALKNATAQMGRNTSRIEDASDFLTMLGNWFDGLEKLSGRDDFMMQSLEKVKETTSPVKNNQTTKVLYPVDHPIASTVLYDNVTTNNKMKKTKDTMFYPMYDDNADNAYRSSLMPYYDEDHSSTPAIDLNRKIRNAGDLINLTESSQTWSSNMTTASETKATQTFLELKNKTMVKRSARGPNLVFWNDIYDDEYGIKLDPLDNHLKQKGMNSDLMKKTGVWIQEKMKRMSDSIKQKSRDGFNSFYHSGKRDTMSSTENNVMPNMCSSPSRNAYKSNFHMIDKRDSLKDLTNHLNVSDLSAHIKGVCKKAAEAVQKTKNYKGKENEEENIVSTNLMQKLVQLMSELVDFQVEQKTCIKLPGDLKNFLEWLTVLGPTPMDMEGRPNHQQASTNKDHPVHVEGGIDLATMPSSEREDHTDPRSECLGTIHAIETLINEYAQLSDEDKNKMMGVKEYLEDQLDYITKQLSSIDELNLANIYGRSYIPFRYRRDLDHHLKKRNARGGPRPSRTKRKLRRFLKNYSRKHTKTTPNNFESIQVSTEMFRHPNLGLSVLKHHKESSRNTYNSDNSKLVQDAELKKRDIEINTLSSCENKTKRNLQDVYYKALADAKKTTKISQKKVSDHDRSVSESTKTLN